MKLDYDPLSDDMIYTIDGKEVGRASTTSDPFAIQQEVQSSRSCGVGYSSARCSQCDRGFYRKNERCYKCPEDKLSNGALVGILVAVTTVIILFYLWISSLKLEFGNIMIGITFFQILSLFAKLPDISWDPILLQVWDFAAMLTFDIQLVQPECLVQDDFFSSYRFKFMLVLGFPILAILNLALTFSAYFIWIRGIVPFCKYLVEQVQNGAKNAKLKIRRLRGRSIAPIDFYHDQAVKKTKERERAKARAKADKKLYNFKTKLLGLLLTMLDLLYLTLFMKSAEFFNCQPLSKENLALGYVLVAENSLRCYEKSWYDLLPLAILGLVFYAVGIIGLFFGVLRAAYRNDPTLHFPKHFGFGGADYSQLANESLEKLNFSPSLVNLIATHRNAKTTTVDTPPKIKIEHVQLEKDMESLKTMHLDVLKNRKETAIDEMRGAVMIKPTGSIRGSNSAVATLARRVSITIPVNKIVASKRWSHWRDIKGYLKNRYEEWKRKRAERPYVEPKDRWYNKICVDVIQTRQSNYSRSFVFWDIIVQLRKALITVSITFITDSVVMKIVALQIIFLTALVLQLLARPYRYKNWNRLEEFVFTTLQFILTVSVGFYNTKEKSELEGNSASTPLQLALTWIIVFLIFAAGSGVLYLSFVEAKTFYSDVKSKGGVVAFIRERTNQRRERKRQQLLTEGGEISMKGDDAEVTKNITGTSKTKDFTQLDRRSLSPVAWTLKTSTMNEDEMDNAPEEEESEESSLSDKAETLADSEASSAIGNTRLGARNVSVRALDP